MNFRSLATEEKAVSPVIGVILMVAITVILAAVIGTFVLGLGDQVQNTSPQAQFGFDKEDDASAGGNTWDNLTVTHESGDSIEASQLTVTTGGINFAFQQSDGTSDGDYNTSKTFDEMGYDSVSAGDSVTLVKNQSAGDTTELDGEEFRVVWDNPDSDKSSTLATYEY